MQMPGETDLHHMLAGLQPVLAPETYVFCSIAQASYGFLANTTPLASVQEPEGLTLVLPQEQADQNGLSYEGVFHCIRLDVHSSLEAVGLTAAVSTRLAQAHISANMFAGTHHDLILVPTDCAQAALEALQHLSQSHPVD